MPCGLLSPQKCLDRAVPARSGAVFSLEMRILSEQYIQKRLLQSISGAGSPGLLPKNKAAVLMFLIRKTSFLQRISCYIDRTVSGLCCGSSADESSLSVRLLLLFLYDLYYFRRFIQTKVSQSVYIADFHKIAEKGLTTAVNPAIIKPWRVFQQSTHNRHPKIILSSSITLTLN